MKEMVRYWYNEVNSETLDYVTYSIQDSVIDDFYADIIGFKGSWHSSQSMDLESLEIFLYSFICSLITSFIRKFTKCRLLNH